MAKTMIGIILPGFAGEYDPLHEYDVFEFVLFGPDTFVSKKPVQGVDPDSDDEFWQRVTNVAALDITGASFTLDNSVAEEALQLAQQANDRIDQMLGGGG